MQSRLPCNYLVLVYLSGPTAAPAAAPARPGGQRAARQAQLAQGRAEAPARQQTLGNQVVTAHTQLLQRDGRTDMIQQPSSCWRKVFNLQGRENMRCVDGRD